MAISLQDALAKNFRDSLREEMEDYFRELGEPVPHKRTTEDNVRRKLLQLCGRDTEFSPQTVTAGTRKVSAVVPPYSLIPERGGYGGRRQRCRLHRPDGETGASAGRAFSVNGWSYTFEYGKVQAAPEPIYLYVKSLENCRGSIVNTQDEKGFNEVHTEITFSQKYNLEWLGVDEATKDRCATVAEWYQKKGKDFLEKLESKEIREIVAYLDIPAKDKLDRPIDDETLRQKLIDQFFPTVYIEEAA
jgi:hypothetical protein